MNSPTTTDIEDVFTGLTAERHSGLLDRDDAYDVLLRVLAHARGAGIDRTTAAELHTVIHQLAGSEIFGGRGVLRNLLRNADSDREIRITSTGHVLLRSDVPSDGGPERVWVRLENSRNAEVEVVGASPWPDAQQHAPGPAWWRCTGCRTNSGTRAQEFESMRTEAVRHARDCLAQPAPVASPETP